MCLFLFHKKICCFFLKQILFPYGLETMKSIFTKQALIILNEILTCCKVNTKVTQSCPILCDSMGNTVHGILQARILEWVAVPFSRGSSQARDRTQISCIEGGFFYQLNHKARPRILEWVAYLLSSRSS